MVKIDIISGFLGSGKTTFIKRMAEAWDSKNGTLAVIENDFGSVNLDAAYLSLSNVRIAELNAGCVCCSLAGRLSDSLSEILRQAHPSRIILEPSGVARLSDILRTLRQLYPSLPIEPGSIITMAVPFRSLSQRSRFFGVYKNQLQHANLILPVQLDLMPPEKQQQFLQTLKNDAEGVPVWNAPWMETDTEVLLSLGACQKQPEESQLFPSVPPPKMRAAGHPTFQSLTLGLEELSSPDVVCSFLHTLLQQPEQYGMLLRAKGFLKTKEEKLLKISLNALGIALEPVSLRAQEKLVLIGSSLNRSKIQLLFRDMAAQAAEGKTSAITGTRRDADASLLQHIPPH